MGWYTVGTRPGISECLRSSSNFVVLLLFDNIIRLKLFYPIHNTSVRFQEMPRFSPWLFWIKTFRPHTSVSCTFIFSLRRKFLTLLSCYPSPFNAPTFPSVSTLLILSNGLLPCNYKTRPLLLLWDSQGFPDLTSLSVKSF